MKPAEHTLTTWAKTVHRAGTNSALPSSAMPIVHAGFLCRAVRATCAVWLLAPLAVLHAADAARPARPNILWLVSEDNGCLLGCYGDALARTPTIDKLARDGVLYERCFAMPVCAPSRFTLISGLYPVACGPAHHMRAQGAIPPGLKGFPEALRAAGYYTSNQSKTDYNAPISIQNTWDGNHYQNRAAGQPFFSVFNHEVSHESCLFPHNERSLFDPAAMRIPPYQPDTPEIRADWARFYSRMAQLDTQIAAKLKALSDSGLAEDTIIFYYADNGGILPRSKRFLHESGTHVPLIVFYPPRWQHLAPAAPGTRIKDPVHFIDFAPTVLSLAGVKIPDALQGRAFAGAARAAPNTYVFCMRDRMDELYDMMRSVVDSRWIYIHNYRPDRPYVQHLSYMFRARGYQSWQRIAEAGKLTPATAMFWGEKPTEELYDSHVDPDNVHNLAADPAHRETLDRLRAALKERVVANYDNGFLPEGSVLEGYEASHAPGAYPIDRVFELATLASQREPAHLPALIAALADPSEPIRWWGAQGCAMLRHQAAPAEAALRTSLADRSGAVQIAAAEALAWLGKLEAALPVLEHWIEQPQNGPFATQAGNVLDQLGFAARSSLPAVKAALNQYGKNAGYPVRILTRITNVLEDRERPLVYPVLFQPLLSQPTPSTNGPP